MSFASPFFLWFLPAVALPLIIHLINRRKPRPLPFATLELIRAAHRARMPKRRLRDLLLLIMRTLMILLAVLLFARPVVREVGALSGAGRERIVILMDVSASMGATYTGRTRLETAREEARRLLRITGADAQVGVVTFSDRVEAAHDPSTDRTRVVGAITAARAVARPSDVLPALKAAGRMLAGAESGTVVVLSDHAMNVWKAAAAAAGTWEGFDPSVRYIIRECGEAPKSRGIVSAGLQLSQEGALRGRFSIFSNAGASAAAWSAMLNERVVAKGLAPAAGTVEATFEARLPEGGFYGGKVFLTPDHMQSDDAFYVAGRVPKGFRVLLIDGEPGVAPSDSEVYYLRSAIESPRDPRIESVDTIGADGMASVDLKIYDAIVVANAADLGGREADLRQWVEAGGGLLLTAGSRWPRGRAFVLGIAGSSGVRVGDVEAAEPPATGFLSGVSGISDFDWEQVSVSRRVVPEAGSSHETLIPLENGDPLLFQMALGKGNVLVLTTSLDRAWTNFPAKPSFAPVMRELLSALADPFREQTSLQAFVDEPARFRLPEGTRSVTVVAPDGASSGAGIDRDGRLEWTPPALPGLYEVRTDRPDQWFRVAVNMRDIASEADTRLARESDLQAALPQAPVQFVPYRADDQGLENALEGRDITGLLLLLLGLFLLAETALSWTRREAVKAS